jgi:2-polyprenyl-6-methoxyphenol hydroxylase-like FAD-dependent oxidoreductase
MRVLIVGGGMAGLVLARGLLREGLPPLVLERAPAGTRIPGPIMLPFQAYDALESLDALAAIRARGRDIPPLRNGSPVAIGVGREDVVTILREGVEVSWDQEVVDLLRDGGRVAGVRVRGPGGERDVRADLVVGADGARSRVRELAGIAAEVRTADTAFLSFRSPAHVAEPFLIAFLSDGRQVTVVDWPGGTAGSWQIDRVPGGADVALAPGLEAFRRGFARLLPAAEPALAGVTSPDQVVYREALEVRCETWWTPGVALVGEALHAMNPEAGIGSGLGMGDAQALAIALGRNRDDPDAACRDYEHWRRPAVAPYLAVGSEGTRVRTGAAPRPEERWPPPA